MCSSSLRFICLEAEHSGSWVRYEHFSKSIGFLWIPNSYVNVLRKTNDLWVNPLISSLINEVHCSHDLTSGYFSCFACLFFFFLYKWSHITDLITWGKMSNNVKYMWFFNKAYAVAFPIVVLQEMSTFSDHLLFNHFNYFSESSRPANRIFMNQTLSHILNCFLYPLTAGLLLHFLTD